MSYNSNSLPRQEVDDLSRQENAEMEALLDALEWEDWNATCWSAVNDNPRPSPSPSPSPHGTLAEALAEIARAKAAAKAEKRPASAPGLVTAAEGKAADVVRREEPPAPTKPWEDASEHERAVYINRALVTFGRPVAISINFSPEILAAANDNARGVLDYLRRQVLRHFKRTIGARPTWIEIETTQDRKIHIHGGMALRDGDGEREVERIAALAGGNHSCQGSKPADVREMWFLDGWAGYCSKSDARTRRHLREALGLEPDARVPLYSATADIRTEGRRLYEEARQAAREARQRPAVVEVPQPAPAPAEPASASQDAPAPAARSRRRSGSTSPAVVVIRVAPLGALAVQVVPIPAVSPPRRPTAARSRGPPGKLTAPSTSNFFGQSTLIDHQPMRRCVETTIQQPA